MPYDSSKRLRLYGLVESLDNAVRTNDLRAAQHYRARLTRAIEFAADDDPAKPLHDDLKSYSRSAEFGCAMSAYSAPRASRKSYN